MGAVSGIYRIFSWENRLEVIIMKNNPIELFGKWLKEAQKKELMSPCNMFLATAGEDAKPAARIMTLLDYNYGGFYFCTNASSNKVKEIKINKNASGCFYWDKSARQVRIEGLIEKVEGSSADNFFASFSRAEQILFWASKQSSIILGKGDLKGRMETIEAQFENENIPRPPHFFCFKIVPQSIEFWQDEKYRLHKRMVYKKQNENDWETQVLFP